MAGLIAMATACAGGIAFYLRFLFAFMLGRCRATLATPMQLSTGESPSPHTRPEQRSTAQAE